MKSRLCHRGHLREGENAVLRLRKQTGRTWLDCRACSRLRTAAKYRREKAQKPTKPPTRRQLEAAVLAAAIAWRDVTRDGWKVPPWEYIDVEKRLADAVDALQAAREGKGE